MAEAIAFYFLSACILGFALLVVSTKDTVHSVLFLVLAPGSPARRALGAASASASVSKVSAPQAPVAVAPALAFVKPAASEPVRRRCQAQNFHVGIESAHVGDESAVHRVSFDWY